MRTRMLTFLAVLTLGAVICLPGMALAGTLIFDETTFLTDIQPGYYLEDFNSLTNNGSNPASLTFGPVNGFSYTASATGANAAGLYPLNSALSLNDSRSTLLITFTGAPVTAVGGQFFPTDFAGNDTNGNMLVTFSDGTQQLITMSNLTRPFLGYSVSLDGPSIASLSFNNNNWPTNDQNFPTIDHLYAGTQVPIPGALVLLGAGMVRLVAYRRRKRALA